MKTLKLTIAALLLAFTFQAASAQVRVGVRIGTPAPRHVVIVDRGPYYRTGYYRYRYEHPYYRHAYYRHERFERRHW